MNIKNINIDKLVVRLIILSFISTIIHDVIVYYGWFKMTAESATPMMLFTLATFSFTVMSLIVLIHLLFWLFTTKLSGIFSNYVSNYSCEDSYQTQLNHSGGKK